MPQTADIAAKAAHARALMRPRMSGGGAGPASRPIVERSPARRYGRQVRADRVSDLVPFVHVADVRRSIGFYALLGLEVRDTYEPDGEPVWAFLEAGDARLMVAQAGCPVVAEDQAVLFYLYVRDLEALRADLVAAGVPAGEIVDGTPGPRRELRLSDPDGYCLMVAEIEGERVRVVPA